MVRAPEWVALACYGQPAGKAIFASRAQAHVTHPNELSDAACETLVFMVQDFLAGRDVVAVERERAGRLVSEFPVFAYDRKRRDNPSGFVVETMQAVLQSLFATDNFEDCLIDVVNRGGDAPPLAQGARRKHPPQLRKQAIALFPAAAEEYRPPRPDQPT